MNKISYSILVVLIIIMCFIYMKAYMEDKKRIAILKKLEDMLADGVIDEKEKADIAVIMNEMKAHKKHNLTKKMKVSAFNGTVRGLLFGVITGNVHNTIMSGATQGCLAPICTYIETMI